MLLAVGMLLPCWYSYYSTITATYIHGDDETPLLEMWKKAENRENIQATISQSANTSISKLACIKEEKACRYDYIGDFLENEKLPGIVHRAIPSVPSQRRIPHERANDWAYIFDQRFKPPNDGSQTALFDFNGLLIPLYKNGNNTDSSILESDWDPALLDYITGRYHPYFTKEQVNKVKYLSINRMSNVHSCKPKFKFGYGPKWANYMGISLLDENLSLIEGTDVAVDIDKWLLNNEKDTSIFADYYVVAVRSSRNNPLRDQLFLFASSHLGTVSMPFDIRRVPPVNKLPQYREISWNTKLKSKPVTPLSEFQYGDGLQIRFMDNPGHRDTDTYFLERGVHRGKNFHMFESSNGETFLELGPHGYPKNMAHITTPINFYANEFAPSAKLTLFEKREIKNIKELGPKPSIVLSPITESKKGNPQWSFKSDIPLLDRPRKPKLKLPYIKYRGTSQIIDFHLRGKDVKVGISHSVAEESAITDKRAYLSQFYAFSPESPFEIVALSGYFCLNHMHEEDIGYSTHWISERPVENRTAPIKILNETYSCPITTFIVGFTEMIGSGGKDTIITYGVNDCYSRSIIVPKKKIEMLLLGKEYKGDTIR